MLGGIELTGHVLRSDWFPGLRVTKMLTGASTLRRALVSDRNVAIARLPRRQGRVSSAAPLQSCTPPVPEGSMPGGDTPTGMIAEGHFGLDDEAPMPADLVMLNH